MNKQIKLPNGLATVDVGLTMGVAVWRGDPYPFTKEIKISKNAKSLRDRLEDGAERFERFLSVNQAVNEVLIEGAEVFDSLKSMTAAKRGDVLWLAYLAGTLHRVATFYATDVDIIPAKKWKGQLGKEGTALRVERINGLRYASDHVTDAVGMGFAQVPEVWKLKAKVARRVTP